MNLDARPRLTHARLRRRGDQVLLLAPERGLVLGGAAAAIVSRLDGRTVAELCASLAAEHDAAPDVIERDVLALLDTLHGKGLVR